MDRVTQKIKLWGIVQGVGFRPFVAKCADRYGMVGYVLNIGGLVDVVVTDTPERIDEFIQHLLDEKPIPSEIVHIKKEDMEYREFSEFSILDSDEGGDEAAMIPADLSICPDCLRELYEKDNHRYLHPFISCMVCGPRYTIIDKIPYDRDNTAMIDWPMCDTCAGQYLDRVNRRYHAQTISCHDCGPVLKYKERTGRFEPFGEKIQRQVLDPIRRAEVVLKSGQVIAMKGVGGYNLIADPLNPQAVQALRKIKHRAQKPFAVMFKNLETISAFNWVNKTEARLLNSSAKPILLLEHRGLEGIRAQLNEANPELVNPDWFTPERLNEETFAELERSRFIGSFLPSMGAQHLLLDRFGLLIVTSANVSDLPIIRSDEEMFAMMEKEPLITGCLYNERDIRVRVDDSVVRVIDGQPQMIRRSKGYAPVPLYLGVDDDENLRMPTKNDMILAMGAQLKNSLALSKGSFSYVSQYFGDLDSVENQNIYIESLERMESLFRVKPLLVVCDLHPGYATSAYARTYAANNGNLPILEVQHHHAHIASVMAEHHLKGPVIGVALDGTGYGMDGAIWGGEFMLCEGAKMEREAHLKYIDMLGGDSSMRDAAKSAACYKYAWNHDYRTSGGSTLEGALDLTIDLSDIMEYANVHGFPKGGQELVVSRALEAGVNVFKSSSMGRLFDAVAALLGIKDYNDYEGQCAIMLEDAAARAMKAKLGEGECSEADELAFYFHMRVASLICDTCEGIREKYADQRWINQVALSGGTFQNRILMEHTLSLLRGRDFDVYYNVAVSPNDGGIALGQNYVGLHRLLSRE